jgi:hypothetical protein
MKLEEYFKLSKDKQKVYLSHKYLKVYYLMRLEVDHQLN